MAIFKASNVNRGIDACRSAKAKAAIRYIQHCDGNAIVFAIKGDLSKQTARYRGQLVQGEEGRGA